MGDGGGGKAFAAYVEDLVGVVGHADRRIHPPPRIMRYRNRTYHALRTRPTIIVVFYHDIVVIEKVAKWGGDYGSRKRLGVGS